MLVRSLLPLALVGLVSIGACGGDDSDPVEAPKSPAVAATVDTPAPTVDASAPDVATTPKDASVDRPSTLPCIDQLKQKGITFTETTARGVDDAVKIKGPIGGVKFVRDDGDEYASDPMACSFVLTLERFAQLLKSKGVVKVGTLGSYCYRCCCAWSPSNDCRSPTDPEPDCGSNGYSNHSWGRALDVRYLFMQGGQVYDINDTDQWIEGTSSTTCTTGLSKQTGVSKVLYSIVCETAQQQIFSTILTPNYNDAHRNHWHMDTGQSGPVTGSKVRAWTGTAIDIGDHADVCGGH
jgi:hypothetical protein